jgi:hypothetical protein
VVLDAFRHPDCCFLTPSLETELESATPLDIRHESLIRNWDKLQDWVKLESGSAEHYRSLEQAARRWKEGRTDLLERLALESMLRWKRKENPSAKWAARSHYLSRALHAYPRNAKAAELIRDLLCGKIWCPPLTRALQSESESPLLSATFGPERIWPPHVSVTMRSGYLYSHLQRRPTQ